MKYSQQDQKDGKVALGEGVGFHVTLDGKVLARVEAFDTELGTVSAWEQAGGEWVLKALEGVVKVTIFHKR